MSQLPESESSGASAASASGAVASTESPAAGGHGQSFTGRSRNRATRRSVIIADRVSRVLITVGGIGTIASVLGVALFLIYVVLPLFLPAEVGKLDELDIERGELVALGIDEYQVLGYTVLPTGVLEVFRIDDGEEVEEHTLFEPGELVSSSFPIATESAAFGLADGTLQLVDIAFETEILDREDVPEDVLAAVEAAGGKAVPFRNGMIEPTPAGQYRFQALGIEKGASAEVSNGPVHEVSYVNSGGGPVVVALVEDRPAAEPTLDTADDEAATTADAATEGQEADEDPAASESGSMAAPAETEAQAAGALRLTVVRWEESTNFLTGAVSFEMRDPVDLPRKRAEAPVYMSLDGAANELYSVWEDGYLERVDMRSVEDAFISETGYLLEPGSGKTLSFFAPILGGTTFLWGDSDGVLSGGFTVREEDSEIPVPKLYQSETSDRAQRVFARTKSLSSSKTRALALGPSSRSRLALTGFENGELRLYNITNATELMKVSVPSDDPVIAVAISPKENGLLVATPDRIYHADFDPRYPEAGISAFFRPVWYEGYAEPENIWQSSSGTDDFEMKLGLLPLIFGTLKATFYSMLFGAPLALLAAIFTSEFLHGGARNVIKPSIEFMASLPSVVLGFLAALVFAPFIEKLVPASLSLFIALPVSLLLGAYLWQLLPSQVAIKNEKHRFFAMCLLVPVGVLLAYAIGPVVENMLFGGDIKGWLAWSVGAEGEERFGSPIGGLMLLFVPLSALIVSLSSGRFVNPWMRDKGSDWDRRQYAVADIIKFGGSIVATVVLAFLASWLVSLLGFDPRGSYVDTYVQRNALIVGVVMGFAIIPIIYTIAEDALSTVPEHLRSASLGAGATPWQTATRIVIPTAMSGLFSAMMVGLGRAVGETMIVLMAAGNTPVMEWNVFEGFRTLSANIAVELPEAVKGDTHYRTLFLAALVLFLMTFVVNTVAEIIRLRFRKRAYQL